jgi:alpha-glucosidase
MELAQGIHHDGSELFVPAQSPSLGQRVDVYVLVSPHAGVDALWVRTSFDAEPRFAAAERLPLEGPDGHAWFRARVLVRNRVNRYRFLLSGAGGYRWLTGAGIFAHDVPDDTDFRIVAGAAPPTWAKRAQVYLIFPDRFARSAASADRELPSWAVRREWDDPVTGSGPDRPREIFGGDLDGVRDRLDHIQGLGVDTVCLTPFFAAPANHRYCASSFDEVEPLLGGDAALSRLADALHERGMRLVGDLTTNHTGDQHPWFVDAMQGVNPDVYFMDPTAPHGYETWVEVKRMPKLNWSSTELRRRMLDGPGSVVRRWLRAGLDGWRLDVANSTGRCRDEDWTHDVHRGIRSAMLAERPDALLIGEHAHDFTRDVDSGGWHGTMNYAGFTRPVWSWLATRPSPFLGVPTGVPRLPARALLATRRAFSSRMSWSALTTSWSLLDSHDTPRFRSLVGGDLARQEVGLGLMVTFPGVPMVFAGDEAGVEGTYAEDSRRTMPWDRPDRWDARCADLYRGLLRLRRAHPALIEGGFRVLAADPDRLVFLRESPAERLLVLAARAAGPPVHVPGAAGAENLHGGAPDVGPDNLLPGDGPTFQLWRLPVPKGASWPPS